MALNLHLFVNKRILLLNSKCHKDDVLLLFCAGNNMRGETKRHKSYLKEPASIAADYAIIIAFIDSDGLIILVSPFSASGTPISLNFQTDECSLKVGISLCSNISKQFD